MENGADGSSMRREEERGAGGRDEGERWKIDRKQREQRGGQESGGKRRKRRREVEEGRRRKRRGRGDSITERWLPPSGQDSCQPGPDMTSAEGEAGRPPQPVSQPVDSG